MKTRMVVCVVLSALVFALRAQAEFVFSVDGMTPVNQLVAGGQTVTVGRFKASAWPDSYTLSEINFDVGESGAIAANSYSLYDGSTLLAVVPPSQNGDKWLASFTGLSVGVPGGSVKSLRLDTSLGVPDDISGFPNGTQFAPRVDADGIKYFDENGLVHTTGSVGQANSTTVVKSYPAIVRYTPWVNHNLLSTSQELVGYFVATSMTSGDVLFSHLYGGQLTFNITGYKQHSDGQPGEWSLQADGVRLCTAMVADNATSVTFNFDQLGLFLPAGYTKELKVYGDTTDYNREGDWIQLSIPRTSNSVVWAVDGSMDYSAPLAFGQYVGGTTGSILSNGTPAPEPGTIVLLLAALAGGLALVIRCKR